VKTRGLKLSWLWRAEACLFVFGRFEYLFGAERYAVSCLTKKAATLKKRNKLIQRISKHKNPTKAQRFVRFPIICIYFCYVIILSQSFFPSLPPKTNPDVSFIFSKNTKQQQISHTQPYKNSAEHNLCATSFPTCRDASESQNATD
jgi:hypothetical protein